MLVGDNRAVRWVDYEGRVELDKLPGRPVEGGREGDGTPLFIAQATYNHAIVPGKCSPKLKSAFVPYANSEKEEKVSTVLFQTYRVQCQMMSCPALPYSLLCLRGALANYPLALYDKKLFSLPFAIACRMKFIMQMYNTSIPSVFKLCAFPAKPSFASSVLRNLKKKHTPSSCRSAGDHFGLNDRQPGIHQIQPWRRQGLLSRPP